MPNQVQAEIERLRSENACLKKRVEALQSIQADLSNHDLENQGMAQALFSSRKDLEQILHSIQDGFFVLDENLRIVYFNDAAGKYLGVKPCQVVGNLLFEMFPEAAGSVFEEQYRAAVRDQQFQSFETYFGVPPYEGWYAVRVFPVSTGISVFFHKIDEQKRAEQALRESEQRYREAQQIGKMGHTIFNIKTQTLEWSEEVYRIFEQDPNADITSEQTQSFVHPDDIEELGIALDTAVKQGCGFENEHRIITGSNKIKYVLYKGEVRYDQAGDPESVIGTVLDITERKLAEEALQKSEERLQLVMAAVEDAVWDWDVPTGQAFFSPRYYTMLGYEPGEFPSDYSTWESMLHPDDLEEALEIIREYMVNKTEVYHLQFRLRAKDGQWRWVLARGQVVERDADGRPVRMVGTHTDITEFRRQQEENLKLESQLQHTQKLESLGVLAGGIAHDFNNLLMAMLGNADLAISELPPSSPVLPYLRDIERASKQAAGLCQQMLAYSGKGRFVVEALNLNDVVKEMTQILEVSIPKKVTLTYNLQADLPTVDADATQIRQVLMNLITNAAEAIGDQPGLVSVTTGAMDCDQQYFGKTLLDEGLKEGTYVFVEVGDTGCGMSQETRQRMFDPFFTTKFTGRGLGMAAVLGIMRGHRGAIKVYSEEGKGSTIKILLPASQKESVPLQPAVAGGLPAKFGEGLILLVDDEEVVRDVGTAMLRKMGYDVEVARDGLEALEAYRKHHAQGDGVVCVLLDLTMPNMDGEETFRELRNMNPEVQVIMSSGYNQQDVTQRFVGKGLAGFIQKPYQFANLKQTMLRFVEEHP